MLETITIHDAVETYTSNFIFWGAEWVGGGGGVRVGRVEGILCLLSSAFTTNL